VFPGMKEVTRRVISSGFLCICRSVMASCETDQLVYAFLAEAAL